MPEPQIEPLPADPRLWFAENMWGWVNDIKPLVEAGTCVGDRTVNMLDATSDRRPILVRFARPRLVSAHGYSWENHISDEMAQIEFQAERIVISVVHNLDPVLLARLVPVAGMVRLADMQMGSNRTGTAPMSLGDGDWGQDCLAFASQRQSPWLVPDPYFFLTKGYAGEKAEIARLSEPWSGRRSQVYWRGAPSGLQKYEDHSQSQRVKLVLRAASGASQNSFNVRFAGLDGMDAKVAEEVRRVGGDGPREPQMDILQYRYNVDVDGWSCAWTGYFIKLLAGSPILKITSDRGFRQWYYDRLEPWRHYVPVAQDLADLEFAVSVLAARPDWAEAIGENGKALAQSLDFAEQFELGGKVIATYTNK